MRRTVGWVVVLGLVALACSGTRKTLPDQHSPDSRGGVADLVESTDNVGTDHVRSDQRSPDVPAEISEPGCDAIVQVDFPCWKDVVCHSLFYLQHQKTHPCTDYYPDGCCEGASCESAGIEECPAGTHCEEQPGEDATCVPDGYCTPCKPDCDGKQCGSDGCGGLCGTCPDVGFCLEDGLCGWVDPPDCDGKQCGADGMGGSCGICDDGWHCNDARCVPDQGGCDGIPDGGLCMNGWLVQCMGIQASQTNCPFGGCTIDEDSGIASCQEVNCIPNCFGRLCGDDGCGGSCGECGADETCDEHAVCRPDEGCGEYGDGPGCLGHVAVNCNSVVDSWYSESCLEKGEICGTTGCEDEPACRPVWPGTFSCDGLPQSGLCINGHRFFCDEGFLAVEHCQALGYTDCQRTDFNQVECSF